jgi:hypothetical protein
MLQRQKNGHKQQNSLLQHLKVQNRNSFTSNGQHLKLTSHHALTFKAICHFSAELAAMTASARQYNLNNYHSSAKNTSIHN